MLKSECEPADVYNYRHFYDLKGEHPQVPEGDAFLGRRITILNPNQFDALNPHDQSVYACAWAGLTPTSHNTIPQGFKVHEDGSIEVFVDRRWVLGASDREARQTFAGMGGVLTHLTYALDAYGYDCKYRIVNRDISEFLPLPAGSTSDNPVWVKLFEIERTSHDAGQYNEPRLQAMKERKVNRGLYNGQPLSNAVVSALCEMTETYERLQLHMVTSDVVKNTLGKFQKEGLAHVVGDEYFRTELGGLFQLNTDDISRRGMRGREFGRSDDITMELREGLMGTREINPLTLSGFTQAEEDGMRSASAVICITTDTQDVESWVQTGMLYNQIVLYLQHFGLSHQVHAALTETSFFPIQIANRIFRSTVLRTNRELTAVFRVGVPLDVNELYQYHASKPPVEELLIR